VLLYAAASMYLVHMRGKKDYERHLEGASVPMLLIGGYLVVSGFAGQLTWPLPGSYNILFFDPLVAFGLVILAFALAIRYDVKLEYAGFFGLLVGIMAIIYGFQGYSLGLTQAPIALLLLYFFYGSAGVFSYPVSLVADRLPNHESHRWIGWRIAIVLFCLALFAASVTSAYIGMSAIPGHLLSAP
jgi:putative membrane protein